MLLEMHIKNFAIIDQAYIEFDRGLNVLTGETGAGKTLIISAMNMLLGDRADTSVIRSGRNRASIEGLFSVHKDVKNTELRHLLADSSDEIVIGREILEEGKSKCYLNGKIASVGQLSSIGEALVDLHGQHEHQSLLKAANHLDSLDAFGGPELLRLKTAYRKTYELLKVKKKSLDDLARSEQESARRQDSLKFQIDEIDQANLRTGEEEELKEIREVLMNSEKLTKAAGDCLSLLHGSDDDRMNALDLLRGAISALLDAKGIDQRLDRICDANESLIYTIEDFAREIQNYSEQVEFDPQFLDETEARLSLLSLLKKKYGSTVEEILDYKSKAQAELDCLEDSTEQLARLEAEISQAEKDLTEVAGLLSLKRKETAAGLEKEVQKHLAELNMPRIKFKVVTSEQPDEFGLRIGGKSVKAYPNGVDRVEFFISPNPGEPLKPLSKIASGGELSRMMLASKIALAHVDNIFTMIFDEIDVGIGGQTAFFVGQKLAQLTRNHQVICITHLPQIASFADRHFHVFKEEEGKRTLASVRRLDKENRLTEIARMLGGEDITDTSKNHARETIQKAESLKQDLRKAYVCKNAK